ncbi:hypothetical protein VKT23_007542 [Stygiomarasmius scandens]|uniref:Protein kinase domain-containing protein n=1 Tax=Marasmiellus scandens TaxID=2682957 RepID=A0ABR1JQM6_9AGAR
MATVVNRPFFGPRPPRSKGSNPPSPSYTEHSNTYTVIPGPNHERTQRKNEDLGIVTSHQVEELFSKDLRISNYLANVKNELSRVNGRTYEVFMISLMDWWNGRLGDAEVVQRAFLHLSPAFHLFEDFTTLLETKNGYSMMVCYSSSNQITSAILWRQSHAHMVPLSYEARRALCKPVDSLELRQMIAEGDVAFVSSLTSLHPIWAPCVMQLLQIELDNPASDVLHRKKCLKYLRILSKIFQALPPSLFLKKLTRDGFHALKGGGFADIWKGTANGQTVCLKVLRMFTQIDERSQTKSLNDFCREALIWRQLDHPNVLPFLGVNTNLFEPGFCLVSPWMSNGDIMSFLKTHPDHNRISCLGQIAEGMNYLHSLQPPIVHGDIKGLNILVSDDHQCCLADFGLALAVETQIITTSGAVRGSMRWLAPEVINPDMYPGTDRKDMRPRDVYAFGCTALEILSGRVPFAHRKNEGAVMFDVVGGIRPTRPESPWCSDYIWRLIQQCWAQDISSRPSAEEIQRLVHR